MALRLSVLVIAIVVRDALGNLSNVSSATPSVWTEPFVDGVGGWKIYRIPSLVVTTSGDLLLFVEGRKLSRADHDWNDVLSRRSVDGGRTWGPIQVVHSESTPSNHVTIGNPSPVVLSTHPGCIVLFFCRNNMKVGSMVSHDDGKTWGLPNYFLDGESAAFRSLLSIPPNKNVSHIAAGPPTSLQLESGRVLIPTAFCLDGRYEICSSHAPGDWFAATLYTDDIDDIVHGNDATWHVSNKNEQGNECQVAQTQNGSLLLNQRTGQGHRQLSWSSDGGATWSKPEPYALGGPEAGNCCCSTVLVPSNTGHKKKQNIKSTSLLQDTNHGQTQNEKFVSRPQQGTLVFSGPDAKTRTHMTLYTSSDSGANWSKLIQVDAGAGAYSSLVSLNATHVGLAYEGFLTQTQKAAGLQYVVVSIVD